MFAGIDETRLTVTDKCSADTGKCFKIFSLYFYVYLNCSLKTFFKSDFY